MYVQKDVTGWLVCEEDGDILKTFRSKAAATRWMNDMKTNRLTDAEIQRHIEWRAGSA